jgi:quinol monooxygenase YgiN
MVIVMGTCKMAAGEIDRLIEPMRAQIEATRAETGCLHYAFSRDVLDPDLLQIGERWESNEAIEAHFQSLHMATFNAVLKGASVLSISVKAYDESGERVLIG